jgi:hypothetical protein
MDNDEILSSESITPDVLQEAEKMVPQSMVNKLVGEARKAGRAQGLSSANQAPAGIHLDEDTINSIVHDKVQNLMSKQQEQVQSQMYEQKFNNIISKLDEEISGAKESKPDFEDKLQSVDFFKSSPELYLHLDEAPNKAEVLYHLAENPDKALQIITAIKGGHGKLAQSTLNNLGKRLEQNESGGEKIAKPLEEVNGDNSSTEQSFADYYRNKYHPS